MILKCKSKLCQLKRAGRCNLKYEALKKHNNNIAD